MIGSPQELKFALGLFKEQGVIKIIADVKPAENSDDLSRPSMESATQTIPAQVETRETPGSHGTQPLTHMVHSILGALGPALMNVEGQVRAAAADSRAAARVTAAAARQTAAAAREMPAAFRETPATGAPTTHESAPEPSVPSEENTEDAPSGPEASPGETGERPFIHGRHTCDGCLTTPIVGKRFHAVDMPDYDLCEPCRHNYKGEEMKFEEATLGK
jgi:hypothetical protein